MKIVNTSKGKFNITDSLYESLLKNNAEILEDFDPSFNVFSDYEGKVAEIIEKFNLNEKEKDNLVKKLKSYENGVKKSFGDTQNDKVYDTCIKYLDSLTNKYDNKSDFLSNVSSEYDPYYFEKEKNKSQDNKKNDDKNKSDENNDRNNEYSESEISDISNEEILENICSVLELSVNDFSSSSKEKIIKTFEEERERTGTTEKAFEKAVDVARKIEEKELSSDPKLPFKDYIEQYDGREAPRIDVYIRQILSNVLPKRYVEDGVRRYMKSFRNSPYTDIEKISDETLLKRNKKDMIEIYNKVIEDCDELKKIITTVKKNNKKEQKISESSEDNMKKSFKNTGDIINDIYVNFVDNGINFVKNNLNDIISGKYIPERDEIYEINEKELKERIKILQSSYITNDTIKVLIKLYDIYIKNSVKENDLNDKQNCLRDIYDAIQDGFSRLKDFLSSNPDKTGNKVKDDIALIIRNLILGISDFDVKKFNDIVENFSDEKFNEWYKENVYELSSNNNLLKYLTNKEWRVFSETLDYPNNSSVRSGEESVKNFVKRIVELVKTVTFRTEIPGSVLNFVTSLKDKIQGKMLLKPPFLSFFNFGDSYKLFLKNQLKNLYVDLTKNEENVYRDIKMHDIYRYIDDKTFWNNACLIHCWSHKAFNIVLSSISEMSIRDELKINRKIVTTGLKSSTIIYSISTNNDEGKYLLRNGKKLELYFKIGNEENEYAPSSININDKKIINKIHRKYFIIVTEGIFRKGEIANSIYNNAKKLFNKSNNFLGIDMSNMHYK